MKRHFLVLWLMMICGAALAEISVSAGGRVGLNLAHIRKTAVPEHYKKKIILGSNFGGTLRVNINEHIGVQAEILFSQKGQRWTNKTDTAQYYIRFVNNYVEFPALAVVRFGSDKVKFTGFAGVYLAYWSGAYTQENARTEKMTLNDHTTDYVFSKKDRRMDWGLSTGVGVNFKVGNGWLEVAARHNLGLISRELNSSGKTYNCNFNLSVGYLFDLKKHE
jgi:hypothetical protein